MSAIIRKFIHTEKRGILMKAQCLRSRDSKKNVKVDGEIIQI